MDEQVSACLTATRQLLALSGYNSRFNYSYDQIRSALVAHDLSISRAAISLARRQRPEAGPQVTLDEMNTAQGMMEIEIQGTMRDRHGRPIVVVRLEASFDLDEIVRITRGSPTTWFDEAGATVQNKVARHYPNTNHTPSLGVTLVLDLGSVSVAQFSSRTFDRIWRYIIQKWSTVYPECLSCVLIVNTLPSFTLAWTALRSALPSFARDRVHVLRSLHGLQTYISRENLPKSLGGEWIPDRVILSGDHTESQAASSTVSELDSINRLTIMLKDAIARRDIVERETIRETLRTRTRFAPSKVESETTEEHPLASLQRVLKLTLEDRDASRRAVDFARNFIATENKERESMKKQFELRSDHFEIENRLLASAIERTMLSGSWREDEV